MTRKGSQVRVLYGPLVLTWEVALQLPTEGGAQIPAGSQVGSHSNSADASPLSGERALRGCADRRSFVRHRVRDTLVGALPTSGEYPDQCLSARVLSLDPPIRDLSR